MTKMNYSLTTDKKQATVRQDKVLKLKNKSIKFNPKVGRIPANNSTGGRELGAASKHLPKVNN